MVHMVIMQGGASLHNWVRNVCDEMFEGFDSLSDESLAEVTAIVFLFYSVLATQLREARYHQKKKKIICTAVHGRFEEITYHVDKVSIIDNTTTAATIVMQQIAWGFVEGEVPT